MNRRSTVIVTAFAAVVLLAWAGAYAANQLAAKPTAVAVVDIEQVFNQLKQKQAIEADFRSKADGLQAEEKQMKTKISDLQAQLDLLPPTEDSYKQKEAELQKAVLELRVWVQFQQAQQAREQAIQLENLYRKTTETIGAVAQQSGYDLVLFKEGMPTFEGANAQQIMAQVSFRKVLWAADASDLTNAIITRMNNEFDAG